MNALQLEKVDRPMGYRKCDDCGQGSPRYRMSMADYPVLDDQGEQVHVCARCAREAEKLWQTLTS